MAKQHRRNNNGLPGEEDERSLLPFQGNSKERLRLVRARDLELKSLNLYDHGCLDPGAQAMAKLLAVSKRGDCQLTSLNLGKNSIGDAGAAALGEALAHNRLLTSLSLQLNRIGPEGAHALGRGLRHNTGLLTLDLLGNCLGDGGASSLAHELRHNKVLRDLSLRQNGVRKPGVAAILHMLEKNRSIQSINLEPNVWGSVHNICLMRRDQIPMILSFGDGLADAAQDQESEGQARGQRIQIRERRVLAPPPRATVVLLLHQMTGSALASRKKTWSPYPRAPAAAQYQYTCRKSI